MGVFDLLREAGFQVGEGNDADQYRAMLRGNSPLAAPRVSPAVPLGVTVDPRDTESAYAEIAALEQAGFGSDGATQEVGGFWGSAPGKAIAGTLSAVDYGRAAVTSAVAEGNDWVQNNAPDWVGMIANPAYNENREGADRASWQDFKDQLNRRMGYGETVDTGNKWADRAAGFVGDVVTDPLTYVSFGVGSAVKKGALSAAEASVEQAVKSGARSSIAKALATNAAEAGVIDNPAVKALIAEAGQSGRAALTRGAARRAGLSASEAAALGVRDMRYTFGAGRARVTLPGSRVAAETSARFKGTAMKVLGETAAAQRFRALRIPVTEGERALTDIMRSKGHSVGERAAAAAALATINPARGKAYKWADLMERRLHDYFQGDASLKSMDAAAATRVFHEIESGVLSSPVAQKTSKWLYQAFDDLEAAGALTRSQFRSDYVPWRLSDDAAKLVAENPHYRDWVDTIDRKASFQKARRLTDASDTFMGEALPAGETRWTARLVNDISQAKLGIDWIDTDVREVFGHYINDGAKSIMKAAQIDALAKFGLVTDMSKFGLNSDGKDAVKAAKKVAKQAKDDADGFMVSAAKSRQRGADEATDLLRQERDDFARQVRQAQSDVRRAERDVVRTEGRLQKAKDAFDVKKAELDQWRSLATKAKRKSRDVAKRIARLEGELDDLTKFINDLEDKLVSTKEYHQKLLRDEPEMLKAAQRAEAALQQRIDAGDRMLMRKQGNLLTDVGSLPKVQQQVAALEKRQQAAKLKVAAAQTALDSAQTAADDAVNVVARLHVTRDRLVADLDLMDQDLNDFLARSPKVKGVSAKTVATLGSQVQTRLNVVKDAANRWGNNAAVQAVLAAETTALKFDLDALKAGTVAVDAEDMIKAIKDGKFVDMITYQADQAFRKISATEQMPGWLDDALSVQNKIREPGFWDDAAKFMDRFNNWWKGWATARPGFVIRNAYGGAFNVYLEAGLGGLESMREFRQFMRIYRANPDDYMPQAVKRFGAARAAQMDDALQVVYATGGGLVPAEVAVNLAEGRGGKWLSLGSNAKPIAATRGLSENVENVLRGGHALDVIKRGGNVDTATDVVTRWHFNYRDITDFDRTVKRVGMPFWTFFSRNMALQAQVWTKYPARLNRSYMNLKRNMELGSEDDPEKPEYLTNMQAMRLPVEGLPGNGVAYLTPDLPPFRFAEDLSKFTDPSSGRFLSDLGPFPKAATELLGNRQFFTGREFKNQYTEYAPQGLGEWSSAPREAPMWAQVPGVRQLLEQMPGDWGVETYADGTPVMTDRTQAMFENFNPLLGNSSRLFANQSSRERNEAAARVSALLGIGYRVVDDDVRSATRFNRERAIQEILDRKEDLGF